MLARFKELARDIQDKARGSIKKTHEEPAPKVVPLRRPAPERSFCDPNGKRPCITVCAPGEGCGCGCEELRQALEEALERSGLEIAVGKAKTGCPGSCAMGPFVGFPQKGFFYVNVDPRDAGLIVEETLRRGKLLFPYLSVNPARSYRQDILYDRTTGMLAAIDEQVCMVEVAKYFLDFEEGLSCGKCVPCRLGIKRMHESLGRIVEGAGTMEDLEQIKVLAHTMIYAAHCQFAMASSRPVLSAVSFFEDEFLAHIQEQQCPAGVCEALVEIQRKKAFRERMAVPKKKKKGK
ncbi:NADH-ubiquinone oxidoreductase-F iron-sulfur binding region [Desulfacinum hydrothermale DSM 13146]|uniref:NADH-ubiquinone oxidoreductase-F iron-sulfur binding region n=1 Tax=Desulfacinum hydrothermale DSM 13146 TaxID=1121390 RepID=A0A1W1XNZ2_9BACT|nr:NADH-ubiquinone oxidoreductase-F iron-sulfur binding region domain-containing protein [Desulfacinum hydrothermale]SMC25238.1 NADH-ubiquinone oxidoreductase-F iron-sulfur binding region [Desulfacinum hydrothermale DSM 13146]